MSDSLTQSIQAGDVAIVATDTVYGLVALPGSKGYEDIFALKGRPVQQALPWLVDSSVSLERYGSDVPEYAKKLTDMFWPGALTLVVRASDEAVAFGGVAADGTVALRCPDDERLRALLEELACPLACTSANVHGSAPATKRSEVPQSMSELPGFDELEDLSQELLASTIVDCTGAYPKILRDGPIPEQVVLDVAVFGATLTS